MEDRLENVESAIFALDDAIAALEALGADAGCDVECLREMRDMYAEQRDEINAEISAQYAKEQAALEREYYRGLM